MTGAPTGPRADRAADALDAVRARIAAAAGRASRDPADVLLVGASKTVPAPRLVPYLAAGLVDLGENRAQELVAKAAELDADAERGPQPRWHFLGRLQRNKVAALARRVATWQSVDRTELGPVIARHQPGATVFVQVDLAGEPQKGGCPPKDAPALVDGLRALDLQVAGLMTVPPAGAEPRRRFAELRELAGHVGVAGLSMGMSSDFEIAVEEGATVVRVGRSLFGARPPA